MKSFLKRFRQLHLRLKTAPFALVIAIVGLSFYMRRPLVDFTLERVTQEGDWIGIECNRTNTSNELVSVTTDLKARATLMDLDYVKKIPIWWEGNRRVDRNYFTPHPTPPTKSFFESRDQEYVELSKHDSIKVIGYIHEEAANYKFKAMPFYSANDSSF